MLDNDERVGFLDVMVDLIQKVVAGYVKTAFMDKTFPNNPAMKVGDQVFAIRLHCWANERQADNAEDNDGSNSEAEFEQTMPEEVADSEQVY